MTLFLDAVWEYYDAYVRAYAGVGGFFIYLNFPLYFVPSVLHWEVNIFFFFVSVCILFTFGTHSQLLALYIRQGRSKSSTANDMKT